MAVKRLRWFGILWATITILASVPLWLTLPEPEGAQVITTATQISGEERQEITLPKKRQAPGSWGHYRLVLDIDHTSQQYLYIPVLSQRATIELNGILIDDTGKRTTMLGLASGTSAMVALPPSLISEGRNIVDLHIQSVGLSPAYLAPVYVGSIEQLGYQYRLRVFLFEYLKLMVLAAQLLIALVVLVVWLYRPRDRLFAWLTLLLLLSMVAYLGLAHDLIPSLVTWMPYFSMLGGSAALIIVIVAMLITGHSPPRFLQWAAFILPASSILLALLGVVSTKHLVLLINIPLNITCLLVSLAILMWAALRYRHEEAWLLLFPLLMTTIASIHDVLIILSMLDGPIFLSIYYRPLLLIGFAIILMRRLGISLTQLDSVNIYLKERLNAQEQQLARMHAEEQREAYQRILNAERQRLTTNLHDGLSGHLASIIALSERGQPDQVEHAAREALDDLRLVIHSLDVDDRGLLLALDGLRERLCRQFKRLGITLDWSMARLPEISGVTPSQALNVLRILQEAATNAIKHGKATRITVRGDTDSSGQARITMENNGVPCPKSPKQVGCGLKNIHQRIHQLGGDVFIEPLDNGTRLTLLLPLHLPLLGDGDECYVPL